MSDSTPLSGSAAAQSAPDHAHGDGHGHAEIHMPPNSWAPISLAFALTCTFVGFVTGPLEPWLWIVGVVWTAASCAGWYRAARTEFHELPD